jgi:hypothetical protein
MIIGIIMNYSIGLKGERSILGLVIYLIGFCMKAGTGCGACVPELEGLLRRALNPS